jgi:hypothetical protein
MTATQAAEATGESVASCSFHLRQLAKYGLVEEAGGGRGREKPWQATALSTSWDRDAGDPAAAAAVEALQLAIAERYFEFTVRWIDAQSQESTEWQDAAQFGDSLLYLTPAELRDLTGKFKSLLRPYVERLEDAGKRPADARLVTMLHLAFPNRNASEGTTKGSDS